MRARLCLIAACLFVGAANAAEEQKPKLESGFQPMQLADGTKLWRYVVWRKDLNDDPDALIKEMGKARWCPNGWEETKRYTVSVSVVIEGRCK